MSDYAPPRGLGQVVTSADQLAPAVVESQHIVSLTADKITAGTIDASKINVINLNAGNITTGTLTGLTINGGASFSDSLGTFYPVVINAAGDATINSSDNHKTSLVFHNTKTSLTDLTLGLSTPAAGQALVARPNSSSASSLAFSLWDKNDGSSADGFDFVVASNVLGIFRRVAGTTTQIYAYPGDNYQIDGIASSAKLQIANQYYAPAVTDTIGSTTTTNLNLGNVRILTLTTNVTTWTITNPQDGARYMFFIFQDGTGGRTFAFPASFKWPAAAAAPTVTATASHGDIVSSVYHGGNFYSVIAANYG